MSAVPWLEQWFTGMATPGVGSRRRVIVVESAELVEQVVADLDDGASTILTRAIAGPLRPGDYQGSFLPVDGQLTLAGPLTIDLRSYGLAEIGDVTGLTVLRVADDEDFSAYLRDADTAWTTGVFARHLTQGQSLVADLAGLGGAADRSGPRDRMLVRPDGTVSTSPTGGVLGRLGTSTDELDRIWRAHVACSVAPCPVCLSGALPERDRVDALRERPWLARYLTAVEALRRADRDNRVIRRVSGFGGRISPTLHWEPTQVDPVEAPVVLELDDPAAVLVHHPTTGTSEVVSRADGGQLEASISVQV